MVSRTAVNDKAMLVSRRNAHDRSKKRSREGTHSICALAPVTALALHVHLLSVRRIGVCIECGFAPLGAFCRCTASSKRGGIRDMVRVLYFSPLGGTRRAAEGLVRGFGEEADVEWKDISSWDYDADKLSFAEEDVCIVALPCFGGRAPQFAVPRMRDLKANGASAILLTAYGNREFEDILLEMQDSMEHAGFYVRGAVAAVAQHSFCADIATGRPTEEDMVELEDFGRRLRGASQRSEAPLVLPGNRPFRDYAGVPFHVRASDKCIECGMCIKACPVQAIPELNPRHTDDLNCMTCMQCVRVCPEHARDLDPWVYDKTRENLRKAGAFDGAKPNALFMR